MTKLFGFFKARGGQPARLVRVDANGQLSKNELRRKLVEISNRKSRLHAHGQAVAEPRNDEPPANRVGADHGRRLAAHTAIA
jgi:hypothetical protein